MGDTRFDVCGIGNAIVDIIGRCDDAFLAAHDAAKGHMQLVDAETITKLYDAMGPAVEISGGSGANTMVGLASFGAKAAFIGKVGRDDFGGIFAHDIKAAGVTFDTAPSDSDTPTARSLILVTPDGERTMNTFLGVSPELGSGEIDKTLIADSAVTYLEGYLFDRDEAKAAFTEAAGYAKAAGRKVALTLSDGFCVDRHRDSFLALIKADIDILFANEAEITSLYSTQSFDDAARQAAVDTQLSVLTRSEKGSTIISGSEQTTVQAVPVAEVVDTTGAGDLYAAGFLFGHTRGLDHATSARLGSIAAAEIISHVGARPESNLGELARKNGLTT
ncbi:MAG: adenosine kinase [Hyphomicrobiaceae bacterium]